MTERKTPIPEESVAHEESGEKKKNFEKKRLKDLGPWGAWDKDTFEKWFYDFTGVDPKEREVIIHGEEKGDAGRVGERLNQVLSNIVTHYSDEIEREIAEILKEAIEGENFKKFDVCDAQVILKLFGRGIYRAIEELKYESAPFHMGHDAIQKYVEVIDRINNSEPMRRLREIASKEK